MSFQNEIVILKIIIVLHKGVEGIVAQWCNPLTLKSEQSGRVGSITSRTPPLERHDFSYEFMSSVFSCKGIVRKLTLLNNHPEKVFILSSYIADNTA